MSFPPPVRLEAGLLKGIVDWREHDAFSSCPRTNILIHMKKPPARDRTAYRGPAFTIEWYWDPQGRSPALEYFDRLPENRQDDLLMLLKRMGDFGRIFDKTKFRNQGDQIFAFKPRPDRFLCFFTTGRKIIITNAFIKKSNRLTAGEKDRALRAMADFEGR